MITSFLVGIAVGVVFAIVGFVSIAVLFFDGEGGV